MTHEQFTEELYRYYESPEAAAIALTASVKHYETCKEKLERDLVTAIVEGGETLNKWEQEEKRYTILIENGQRKLEELQAYIAVGFPACLTTNASSVLDEYKRKMVIYNAKQSGISISDDHVIMDEDDPLDLMNM